MSNSADAENVLIAECGAAVEDIKRSAPMKSCQAHEPLSRGVIVLLRCQRAALMRKEEARASRAHDGSRVRVWLAQRGLWALFGLAAMSMGVALGGSGLLAALKRLF